MPRERWGERGAYARENNYGRGRYNPYGNSSSSSYGRNNNRRQSYDASSSDDGCRELEPILADMNTLTEKHHLSDGQRNVLRMALDGKSMFFTGSAGAGKSYCLKVVISELRKHNRKVAVTASTGAAAILIGGMTLHSWAGIGIGEGTFDTILAKVLNWKRARKHWQKSHVLVIDEISMLDPKLFDLLDRIGKRVRGNPEPFGGLQLILCGDFAQLPPVQKNKVSGDNVFAFQASSWKRSVQQSILLTKVFRQKDDEFLQMLNEVRFNQLLEKSIRMLEDSKHNDLSNSLGILPTKLYARNRDVDKLNLRMLSRIKGEEFEFKAFDWGSTGANLAHLKRNSSYPEKLALKVGAQVMLLKNIDFKKNLVNGSRGVVTSITEVGITVQFMEVEHLIEKDKHEVSDGLQPIAYRYQYPLKLAWAMTIHKAQGATCDLLEVDLDGCFEAGQAYTALSRSSDYKGLKVLNFTPRAIDAHPLVVQFHRDLYSQNNLDFDKHFPASTGTAPMTKLKRVASSPDKANALTDTEIEFVLGRTIDGATFCITGEMANSHLSRERLQEMIAEKGGSLKSTVSKNTDYLLAGVHLDSQWAKGRAVESTSKYKKAQKLKVPIISEGQFLFMYRGGSSKAPAKLPARDTSHEKNKPFVIDLADDTVLPKGKPFVPPTISKPLDLFEDPFA